MSDEGNGDDHYRPNLRHAFQNWSSWDGPFTQKLALTAKNEWRKLRRFRDCCDHIDEPGC